MYVPAALPFPPTPLTSFTPTSIIEINLAVSCGCLSVIRPFLRHHLPGLIGDTHNRPTPNLATPSSSKYNKARPSDYFSKRKGKLDTGESYLSTTTSLGALGDDRWDKEGGGGQKNDTESGDGESRGQDFDFELGAIRRDGGAHDDDRRTNNDGILKTVEYDVRESYS